MSFYFFEENIKTDAFWGHVIMILKEIRMKSNKIFSLTLFINLFLTVIIVLFLVTSSIQKDYRYTLYIGLNDQDTTIQEIETAKAKTLIDDICAQYVEGFTSFKAEGAWLNDDMLIYEQTWVYEFVDAEEQEIKAIMDELLIALNQACILMEKEEIEISYYEGK